MSRIAHLALNAADHLMSKGRLDAAASILQNYLSTNRPEPQVLQRLGRIYLAQGRSAEAVPLLQQALTCFEEPAVADGTNRRGEAAAEFDPTATQAGIDSLFIATH